MRETVDASIAHEEPRVLDTYSTVYAFILLFLLPGVALMSRLPFGDDRSSTYTFEYVSLVTLPFVLGLALTFLVDSPEGIKRALLRFAILTPLVILTGVTFMFGFSAVMIPASKFVGIADQGLTIVWWAGLALVAAPLFITVFRLIRDGLDRRSLARLAGVLVAIGLVVLVVVVSLFTDIDVHDYVRKDVVIYVVGALSWYLPSFGIAAGLWRASGLV